MELAPLQPIITQYGLLPDKKLGQNFLLDYNLISKIVRCAGDLSDTHVLEVGPGPGGLTRCLLAHDARYVTVIEKDARCIQALQALQEEVGERLTIMEADALHVDVRTLIPRGSHIVANLPYNVGTSLLLQWLEHSSYFAQFTLMFQKEVAERIVASPHTKAYGRLSVLAQWLCDAHIMFEVPPEAFYPPPKVTSAIIILIPRETPRYPAKRESLETVCKVAFGKRRKMLRSSLRDLTTDPLALLEQAAIDPERRPETLTVEEFCRLSQCWDAVNG